MLSDCQYVKVISPEQFVGCSELKKINDITKVRHARSRTRARAPPPVDLTRYGIEPNPGHRAPRAQSVPRKRKRTAGPGKGNAYTGREWNAAYLPKLRETLAL
jgi:hypothetical protein